MVSNKSNTTKQTEDFIKQGFDSFTQNMDAFSCFTKDTVDAVIKSSNATTKGVEEIFSELVNCSKNNVEVCVNACKDMASARSIDQLVSIQTEQSKKYFETCVSQLTKVSELMLSVSKDVSSPFNEHVTSFSDKFMKKAA